MRKLDRYISTNYLLSLGVSALVLVGLYIVIHLFTSLLDFIEIKQKGIFFFIIQYYFYRLPLILLEILPIITLIAAMLTITQFIKRNELIPMLCAGINIYRILRPIFIIAIFISTLMFIMEEKVIPMLTRSLSKTDKILESEGMGRYITLRSKNDHSVVIERYNYVERIMYNVTVTKFGPTGELQAHIFAQTGKWITSTKDDKNSSWHFYDGIAYFYNPDGLRKGLPQTFGQEGFQPEIALMPEELEKSDENTSYTEISDLQELIERYPHQVYLKVRLYKKIASPLGNLILLLLGLPFVLMGDSKNFFVGGGICLAISLAFFMTQFLAEDLGNKAILSPLLATGLPLMIFGLIAFKLMKKVRT